MKKNKLLESFDLIDDKFIDEAENAQIFLSASKRTRRNALIGGAALLMSVLVVFTSIYFFKDPQPIQTPVNTDYLTETPPDSSFGTPVQPPTCEPDITLGDDIRLEHISRELFEKSEYKELIKKTAIFLYDHNHNNEYNYQCPFLESDIVELHYNTWELQYENTTYCEINGVIEGSTLIQSDDYTYYFSREAIIKDDTTGEEITLSNVLQIYKIKNGKATLISRTSLSDKFGFEPRLIQEFINEMYISKDNKTLTLFLYNSKDYITTIVSLDVSKPTDIKLKNTVKLTGKYETSRSVDGKIIFVGSNRFFHVPINGDHNHYMISYNDQSNYVPQIDFGKGFEYFLPTEIVCPENITNLKYTIIYQFDENTFEPVSKLAYMAKPTMFYFTSETLYLVTAIKEQKPVVNGIGEYEVIKFMLDDISKENIISCSIKGELTSRHHLNEYNGFLRIFTSTVESVTENGLEKLKFNTNMYCIDVNTMTVTSSFEQFYQQGVNIYYSKEKIGQIYSVKFIDNLVYVDTRFDDPLKPLYIFDFTDVNNVTCKNTLITPGILISSIDYKEGLYLAFYGTRTNHRTPTSSGNQLYSTKLELYKEISNYYKVEKADVYDYDEEYKKYSKKFYLFPLHYKSYLIDKDNNLFGYDVLIKLNNDVYKKYVLHKLENDKISTVISVDLPVASRDNTHSIYENGYLYIFDGAYLGIFEINN